MRHNNARSWEAYNLAKERRFQERTAQLELVQRPCEDCDGKGVDAGSLYQPESCPSCAGSGLLITERIARKPMGTATTALPDSSTTQGQDGPTPKEIKK